MCSATERSPAAAGPAGHAPPAGSGQAGTSPARTGPDYHMGGQAGADALTAVTQAIDDLAAENLSSADSADLTGRVASVWTLIGDMDPELTRRAAGYHRRRDGNT